VGLIAGKILRGEIVLVLVVVLVLEGGCRRRFEVAGLLCLDPISANFLT